MSPIFMLSIYPDILFDMAIQAANLSERSTWL